MQRKTLWQLAAWCGLIGLFLWLRVPKIIVSEMWYDEAFTHFVARQSGPMMGQSPLYLGVIWLWGQLTGGHIFALRGFSLLCGGLGLPLLWQILRHLKPKKEWIAYAGVLFFVVNPYWIDYDIEARSYALSKLLTLVATFSALKKHWRATALAVGLGILTHIYFVFIAAVIGLWILLQNKQSWRQNFTQLLPIISASIAALLLFFSSFSADEIQHTQHWLPATNWDTTLQLLLGYFTGVRAHQWGNTSPDLIFFYPQLGYAIGGSVFLFLLLQLRQRTLLSMAGHLLLACIAISWLFDFRFLLPRYFIPLAVLLQLHLLLQLFRLPRAWALTLLLGYASTTFFLPEKPQLFGYASVIDTIMETSPTRVVTNHDIHYLPLREGFLTRYGTAAPEVMLALLNTTAQRKTWTSRTMLAAEDTMIVAEVEPTDTLIWKDASHTKYPHTTANHTLQKLEFIGLESPYWLFVPIQD